MKRAQSLGLLLFVVLGVGLAVYCVRVAYHYQHGGSLRAEVGRLRLTRLAPATRQRLETLDSRVFATYYVSGVARMPSHMRRVERQVTDLLEALQSAAPERFDFQIVDPQTEPDLATFASRRRIAPFRVKSIARDAHSERTVWSSLALRYGGRPEVVLNGIGPDHLPRLQALVVERLDRVEHPRRPVLALSAPPGFDELGADLAERGELVRVSLDASDPFPTDADLLFWMRPRVVTPERLRQLDRFLDDGHSVVIAGSRWLSDASDLVTLEGEPALVVRDSGYAADTLLSFFGLRAMDGLLLDHRSAMLRLTGEPVAAPFIVHCIAPNQDFRLWSSQPNGTLLFTTATPILLEPAELSARGWSARVLATSSDRSWVQRAPLVSLSPPLKLAEMSEEAGVRVAKQPLLVELTSDEPWRGSVVFSAASTLFQDGIFTRGAVAHRPLVRTLVDQLASEERRIAAGAKIDRPDPIAIQSATERGFWRGFTVGLLPLVLLLIALARGVLRPAASAWFVPLRGSRVLRGVAAVVGVGLAVLLALRLVAALPGRLDATRDGLNELTAGSRDIAGGVAGELAARLVFSSADRLPLGLRRAPGRVADLLAALERAGAPLSVERIEANVDELDDAARRELASVGIEPFSASTREEESTTIRHYYAHLELGDERLVFPDARALENLEFKLAFALWRRATGKRPHIAFASDVPRLSAAEAHENFQQQGLFAPMGVDVYGVARALLEENGFRVTHVNPRDPELPPDTDLLIWLQPRRSITRMLEATVRYLHGGGRVLLSVQHFNIQSRQYRGADFDVVYWPQPQTPDIDHLYFPELSIEMVREVLFDRLATRLEVDTLVAGRRGGASPRRGAIGREYVRQESALPFLLRTAAANYAADSPITRHLGDQAFLWGSFLRWDEERLAELGLTARPLITTSANTWTFPWKGGWLPVESLAGPPTDGAGEQVLGKLPLAVLFEGRFPRPERPIRLDLRMPGSASASSAPASAAAIPAEQGDPWPEPSPGQLLFIACSEFLKDHRILDPEFRGDHLLLNAAATMTLEPELVESATRRAVPRGFGLVEPETRLFWRAVVLAAGPTAMLVLALALFLLRRRRPAQIAYATSDGGRA